MRVTKSKPGTTEAVFTIYELSWKDMKLLRLALYTLGQGGPMCDPAAAAADLGAALERAETRAFYEAHKDERHLDDTQ